MELKIVIIVLSIIGGFWPIFKAIRGKDLTLRKGRGTSNYTIDFENTFGWYWGRIMMGLTGLFTIIVGILVAIFIA